MPERSASAPGEAKERLAPWIGDIIWPKVVEGIRNTAARWSPPLTDDEQGSAAADTSLKVCRAERVRQWIAEAETYAAHHWAERAEQVLDEIRGYAYAAGVNAATSRFRDRGTGRRGARSAVATVPLDDIFATSLEPREDPGETEDQGFRAAEHDQLVGRLLDLLEQLPNHGRTRYRDVLRLRAQLRLQQIRAGDDEGRIDVAIAEQLRPEEMFGPTADAASRERACTWARTQLKNARAKLEQLYVRAYGEEPMAFRKRRRPQTREDAESTTKGPDR